MIFGRAICWLLRRHKWRRPFKNEPVGYKVCRRCGFATAIRARTSRGAP